MVMTKRERINPVIGKLMELATMRERDLRDRQQWGILSLKRFQEWQRWWHLRLLAGFLRSFFHGKASLNCLNKSKTEVYFIDVELDVYLKKCSE